MISVICDIIDCIRNVLQIISLVNIFTIHYANQPLKNGVEVRIKCLNTSIPYLVGIDKQMLESSHYQGCNALVLITVLQTLINESLEVYIVCED